MSTDAAPGKDRSLAERVAELEREVQEISAHLDAQSRQLNLIKRALVGEDGFERLDGADAVHDQLGAIEERLADVETRAPDPSTVEYKDLTRDDKLADIRSGLIEEAEQSDGTAAWGYREVKQRFKGKPADSHCYDLMRDAASASGFTFGRLGPSGKKRLKVDLGEVKK